MLRTGSGWARTGSYGVFDSFGDPDQIEIEIYGPQLYAVGGYFKTSTGSTIDFLVGGQAVCTFPLSDTHTFCGILDTDGLGSLTMAARSGHYGADDFTIAVPEPATIGLLGLGSLALLRKRRA